LKHVVTGWDMFALILLFPCIIDAQLSVYCEHHPHRHCGGQIDVGMTLDIGFDF